MCSDGVVSFCTLCFSCRRLIFFFFNDTATTEIYTLSLHDALPICNVDPLLPAYDVQTMDDVLAQSTSTRRFNTMLLTLLGMTGLVLAAIGVYGVIAFFVTQRTHEIGVRIALGASSGSVVRMVVREGLVLGLAGIALGGLLAAWATRALGSMLFEVSARDPVAYGAAAAVLLLVAVGASWL